MSLPFEMSNFLRVASLCMASRISSFGSIIFAFDLQALKNQNYEFKQDGDGVKVFDPQGILVGESHLIEDKIYLIKTNGKEMKFNADCDQWL